MARCHGQVHYTCLIDSFVPSRTAVFVTPREYLESVVLQLYQHHFTILRPRDTPRLSTRQKYALDTTTQNTCTHADFVAELYGVCIMAYATDAARWRALTVRDADANGHFIYSVKSTRIYCRPTCPGRLARRANVGFYATPFEAEAAGFRACKRCKPNTILEDPQERAVEKACVLIDEALKNEDPSSLRLQDLAKKVNLTPRYFHKIFKDKTGSTPKEYAKNVAAQRSSPNTISTSTTIADGGDQLRDWDIFDFNDLVDMGTDSSPRNMNDSSLPGEHASTIHHDLEFDMSDFLETWSDNYAFDQSISWPADVFVGGPAMTGSYEKAEPSASTLELDAVALLDSNSMSSDLRV